MIAGTNAYRPVTAADLNRREQHHAEVAETDHGHALEYVTVAPGSRQPVRAPSGTRSVRR